MDLYPVHYDLRISPNLETREFTCKESVSCSVKAATKKVTLHSKELTVLSAAFVADSGKSFDAVEISYHLKDTTVTFTFGEELPIGEGKLEFSLRGILNGDMAGFYISNYEDADGTKKVMASTQFEALDVRTLPLLSYHPFISFFFFSLPLRSLFPCHHIAISASFLTIAIGSAGIFVLG